MPDPQQDDPLEQTKMSFAEHLEELRRALFKSLAALLLGTLVGLLFGQQLVDYIQVPLRDALESFYRGQAEQKILERLEERSSHGAAVPDDLQAAAEELADAGFVPYDIYVEREELIKKLGLESILPNQDSETSEDDSLTGGETGDLIHLQIFRPLEEDHRLRLVSLAGQEPFLVYMKASLVLGAVISSPLVFFFIWEFVAAGLYRNERKYVYVFMPMSLGLFAAGAALAFFVVFDFVLEFLLWFNARMGISPTPQISEWLSFVLLLPLGFGISFQLPLVMLFLERIGVFTVASYLSKWRVAVLVIAVLSMFLTPADPGSMLLMGIPLIGLYFGGILLCHYLPRASDSSVRPVADGE